MTVDSFMRVVRNMPDRAGRAAHVHCPTDMRMSPNYQEAGKPTSETLSCGWPSALHLVEPPRSL